MAAAAGLIILTVCSAVATGAVTRSAAWPSAWQSPLGTASVTVTTNYGAYDRGCTNANTTHTYTYYLESGRTEHLGLDLAAPSGAKVYAVTDGRVMHAGELWGSASKGVVFVEHMATNGNRFTAAYGHIAIGKSPLTGATWRAGDVVRRGNVIGTVVLAGTGYHLHFGIEGGAVTYVDPTVENGGTGACARQAKGTTDPIPYLAARSPAALSGSIVGWRNSNGTVTSWRVHTVSGSLMRRWIPNTTVYSCLRSRGVIDRGPMPARFLNQLRDQTGVHTTC
jgi:murein DD-endopeptidase MepM/ murein hydrolase activator NlpD